MGEGSYRSMERFKVVILGSGNVATHLAKAIDKNHHVIQIYSRTKTHASSLAKELTECKATDKPEEIDPNADLYIISVSDDAIKKVVDIMPHVRGIVVHTSGSVALDKLADIGNNIGVFYPLQTFSKETEVNISEVPFFLEASDESTMERLEHLAGTLSEKVYHADSYQRQTLHIAAVFACNFFNFLLDTSTEILKEKGYALDVLAPLINVTAAKAINSGAFNSQTGPAVRGDLETIHKHIDSLDPERKEIYRLLSQSIIDRHKIHKEI